MLKKQYRLTKRGSFTYVYNKGARKFDRLVGLVFVPSKNLKIGFSVPNKVGKSVKRNRLKRQLRAIVRLTIHRIAPAQVVFTLKPGADQLSYAQLQKTLNDLLYKAKLLA